MMMMMMMMMMMTTTTTTTTPAERRDNPLEMNKGRKERGNRKQRSKKKERKKEGLSVCFVRSFPWFETQIFVRGAPKNKKK